MINRKDKLKMGFLTCFLDVFLLAIIYFYKLSNFDMAWIVSVLITHLLFFYGLKENKHLLLEILHVLIGVYILVSIFAENVLIKLISLFLVVVIQLLWIYEKRCILSIKIGFGDKVSYVFLLYTVILAINIGYSYSLSGCQLKRYNETAQ